MSDTNCSPVPFFTPPEWCIIGRDLQCLWQGPVMHHPDVVNIAKNDIEINHILSKTWKYILNRLHQAVFFILNSPKKENTDTDNARVAMPCKSAMNMAQKKRGCRIKAAGQSP
ncbi:hypothetical protein ACRGFF_002800 [Escherichia coli]|uniref:hypothetical protein n=1 Tax=Escherichia coli TaxID=562 RepID=UPI002035F22E|nr:hypothetical protein [Escherichia coli]